MKETFVTFLLDETGSMAPVKAATIGAFNEYVNGLKGDDLAPAYRFSLVKFDSNHTTVVCNTVPLLTNENYRPGAATPLVDACVKAIRATEWGMRDRGLTEADTNVLCVFQTDGWENASTEFQLSDLAALIKEKKALGWSFTFLGAGIDAYAPARQFGIAEANTVSYGKDARHTHAVMDSLSSKTRAYAASGDSATMDWHDADKQAAGDKFAAKAKVEANMRKRQGVVEDFRL